MPQIPLQKLVAVYLSRSFNHLTQYPFGEPWDGRMRFPFWLQNAPFVAVATSEIAAETEDLLLSLPSVVLKSLLEM